MSNGKYKKFLYNNIEEKPVLATLVERCRNNSEARSQIQSEWNSLVVQALTPIAADNPYLDEFSAGDEVSAIVASTHPPGSKGLDCRPRVFDGISKSWKLCDTGSMVTVVRKTENDKVDDSKMLQAVNGSTIKCYGQKSISVRLGRKTYDVIATVADVDQDILGWDFMSKHKLNIEWDDCGELILRDKKADIRAKLKCIALPSGSIPRTALVAELPVPDEFSSEYFEVAAMKSLPSESTASNHIQAKYLRLIEKYPGIDKPNFNDLSTKHGVTHKIPTHGPPFKAKVRPLMPIWKKQLKEKKPGTRWKD